MAAWAWDLMGIQWTCDSSVQDRIPRQSEVSGRADTIWEPQRAWAGSGLVFMTVLIEKLPFGGLGGLGADRSQFLLQF